MISEAKNTVKKTTSSVDIEGNEADTTQMDKDNSRLDDIKDDLDMNGHCTDSRASMKRENRQFLTHKPVARENGTDGVNGVEDSEFDHAAELEQDSNR